MHHKNVYQLVVASVLCAIGLLVPLVMPKIILGPMSFTLGAHVAIFLAMFISPKVATVVCLGTTLGFFMTTPFIIALRAASHLVFALIGAFLLKRMPELLDKPVSAIGFNLGIGVIHALGEVAVVTPFFISGSMFSDEMLHNGFFSSVVILIGAGTILHSFLDFSIYAVLWKVIHNHVPALDKLIKD